MVLVAIKHNKISPLPSGSLQLQSLPLRPWGIAFQAGYITVFSLTAVSLNSLLTCNTRPYIQMQAFWSSLLFSREGTSLKGGRKPFFSNPGKKVQQQARVFQRSGQKFWRRSQTHPVHNCIASNKNFVGCLSFGISIEANCNEVREDAKINFIVFPHV